MGMFDSISFSPPDFNMGDDGGELMRKFLRRKDNRMREEQQQQQFQAGLPNLRKRQEMDNVSRVMNPETQKAQTPNVRFAPYNPGLDEFRRAQTELGRDKLNLAKEKQENQTNLANRGMDVKERLAKLKDMPDSERFKLLQEGKIDLAEYNAAKSMERVVKQGEIRSDQIDQQGEIRSGHIDQQGNIRSGQIEQQGNIRANEIKQRGDIGSSYITQRGDEARKTKAAPSSTGVSNSQQKVALQNRAVQLANQNPELAQHLTFNDQGFPVINSKAPIEDQMIIYKTIYGTEHPISIPTTKTPTGSPGDVNLPVEDSTQLAQPNQPANAGVPTDKYGVLQKTGMFKPGMEEKQPSQPQASQGVMKQYSPSRNQTRISTDGGKTWKIVEGKQ